jgi:uncharacterized membrane protein
MTFDNSVKGAELSRNLALVNYGLLFASIFFAGVPALIAAVIAYSQRDEAPPEVRTHYDFHIKIFWVAFVMTMAAAVCFLTAVVTGVGELLAYSRIESFLSPSANVHFDLSKFSIDGRIVALTVAALILGFVTCVWLVAAPAVGFIRLASARRIGHSARP